MKLRRGPWRSAGSLSAVDGSVVRVGVLGCGTVGASLVALVERQNATIHARTGLSLEISRIAVRDLSRSRPINVENAVFTSDAMAVATDPSIDVIVEVMGGSRGSSDGGASVKKVGAIARKGSGKCVSDSGDPLGQDREEVFFLNLFFGVFCFVF